MGYHTEINTLLGLPKDFDAVQLEVGKKYTIVRDRERVFPLHIALLLVTSEFQFLGYVVSHSIEIKNFKSKIEFEVISLFSKEEQKLYSENFLHAAKYTEEVK
jgi:hypothetical protein